MLKPTVMLTFTFTLRCFLQTVFSPGLRLVDYNYTSLEGEQTKIIQGQFQKSLTEFMLWLNCVFQHAQWPLLKENNGRVAIKKTQFVYLA